MSLFDIFKKKKKLKRYYREWLACHGWGVMTYYDSVWATSVKEAAKGIPKSAYTSWSFAESNYLGYYEDIIRVQNEHLDFTDEELGKIYGSKDS